MPNLGTQQAKIRNSTDSRLLYFPKFCTLHLLDHDWNMVKAGCTPRIWRTALFRHVLIKQEKREFMDNEKFGQFVRSMRKEKQMTQQQLAERLHLTDKAVSKWERGLSLPDISMLEQLARELDVSVVELLCGERKEENIRKDAVEELLVDTMSDSLRKEKRVRRRCLILLGTVIVLAVLTVFYGRTVINFALDRFSEKYETSYHTSEFEIVRKRDQKPESCFIYKEPAGQFRNNYHVMEITTDGSIRELFVLEETGMDLDRAPLLKMDDDCLYVLFDGMDNEDRTERVYQGAIGADPQGFLPRLFRYDFQSGQVKAVPLPDEKHSLLIDAFTYQGEPVDVTQKFKGLLFGINLGFYKGDRLCISAMDAADGQQGTSVQWDQYFENLTKDGGIRSAGWLDGDSYYLAAPDGIRELDLKSGGTKLVKEMDLRLCGRAELKKTALPEGPEWAVVCSVAETVGEYGYPQEWKTVVLGVDESFESMGQVELPLYASAVEWGKTSVMISDGGEAFQSILVDLKSMTGQDAVRAGRGELKSSLYGASWQQRNPYRTDALEESTIQWVYLEGSGEYRLSGTEKGIKEK